MIVSFSSVPTLKTIKYSSQKAVMGGNATVTAFSLNKHIGAHLTKLEGEEAKPKKVSARARLTAFYPRSTRARPLNPAALALCVTKGIACVVKSEV